MNWYRFMHAVLWVILVTITACGGGGNNSVTTGTANVSITDAPAYGYDNVWITVEEIWFHTSDAAGPLSAGWQKFPLSAPVTVDLLTLANGTVSQAIWNQINIPVGTYGQLRIILAGTDDALTASATAAGLTFNNQVVISSIAHPLRIFDARHGIRLAGSFIVSNMQALNIAIDFDVNHDVVAVQRNSSTDYYLKPRLAFFDLDNAGAIVGSIDPTSAANNITAEFVFKAEQPNDLLNPTYHVVKRTTAWDASNSRFVFYPLDPGTYDIILSGIGYETVIIKNVRVVRGTTPNLASNPTIIPQITMKAGTDYPVQIDSFNHLNPTGAWVSFYQTLPGTGELPYEIRFRHANPFTGSFSNFPLSQSAIQVGTYNATSIARTDESPVGGLGAFQAFADAILYQRSTNIVSVFPPVVPPANLLGSNFGQLVPDTPFAASIAGTISLSFPAGVMNNGRLYAVYGGLIMDSVDVGAQMASGGSYILPNIPAGFNGAFYGVEAFGWSTTFPNSIAVSVPQVADLRSGNPTNINLNMIRLF